MMELEYALEEYIRESIADRSFTIKNFEKMMFDHKKARDFWLIFSEDIFISNANDFVEFLQDKINEILTRKMMIERDLREVKHARKPDKRPRAETQRMESRTKGKANKDDTTGG